MSLKRRDIEDIEKEPCKEPPFTKFFVGLVRLVSRVPMFKKRLDESLGGLSGRIFHHQRNKEYKEATEIVLFGLEKYRHKKSIFLPSMDHHDWWQLMKYGVDSASSTDNADLKGKLIEYADTGIEPFEGYYVAHSYLEFSKWKYHVKDHETAKKFAKIASRADSTWAEPDFILGWYALVLGTGNAEDHLSHAIEKDQRLLFRIANDDICKQYPDIISKLRVKYSKVSNEGKL